MSNNDKKDTQMQPNVMELGRDERREKVGYIVCREAQDTKK